MSFLKNSAFMALATGIALAACATGSGVETDPDTSSNSGTTSNGATGGNTNTGGSATSAGGSGGCVTALDCPTEDTDCKSPVCQNGTCGVVVAALGTGCDDDGGILCDATGECVECLDVDDCPSGVCLDGACVDATCMDQVLNGEESDVDCGGTMCTGCENTELCNTFADCLSGFCPTTPLPTACAPCVDHADCTTGNYCDAGGICVPVKPIGDPCGAPEECGSGFCPGDDGVCCNSACDLGCESCSLATNNIADGTCGPTLVCANMDGCCPAGCNETNDTDCGVVDLDVGAHGSTYSSSSSTRGFWFVAPVAFTISELRVPTDVGAEAQNLQVVRFTAVPPDFSASTTAHTTLHYSLGTPGANYVSVNIPVAQGDVIGILGSRGTTTMRVSYASSNPIASTILGQPVTLNRLVYQANMVTTQAGPLSNENGGSMGRIELRYTP